MSDDKAQNTQKDIERARKLAQQGYSNNVLKRSSDAFADDDDDD